MTMRKVLSMFLDIFGMAGYLTFVILYAPFFLTIIVGAAGLGCWMLMSPYPEDVPFAILLLFTSFVLAGLVWISTDDIGSRNPHIVDKKGIPVTGVLATADKTLHIFAFYYLHLANIFATGISCVVAAHSIYANYALYSWPAIGVIGIFVLLYVCIFGFSLDDFRKVRS